MGVVRTTTTRWKLERAERQQRPRSRNNDRLEEIRDFSSFLSLCATPHLPSLPKTPVFISLFLHLARDARGSLGSGPREPRLSLTDFVAH